MIERLEDPDARSGSVTALLLLAQIRTPLIRLFLNDLNRRSSMARGPPPSYPHSISTLKNWTRGSLPFRGVTYLSGIGTWSACLCCPVRSTQLEAECREDLRPAILEIIAALRGSGSMDRMWALECLSEVSEIGAVWPGFLF